MPALEQQAKFVLTADEPGKRLAAGREAAVCAALASTRQTATASAMPFSRCRPSGARSKVWPSSCRVVGPTATSPGPATP